ncbi:tetratricopeptide repeat protein [candidate division KSB1 bacterium]|nr:tetratricopeptide repeat protein [candidate division KSB1 bacterium]
MSKPLSDKQKHVIRAKYKTTSVEHLAKELKADPAMVQTVIDQLKPALAPEKKRVFTVLTMAFPLILLLLLELGLRLFGYGGDLRLFVPATDPGVEDYYRINHDVARRYFYMQNTIPRPTKDLFLKQKPENGYRIFVLGGSTAAGFPYGNNLTFSRILNKRLDVAFPDKRIEVINVSMAAICSYTLVDFMDEILAMAPDALLVYAGHNEFYGAMGVGSMESLGKNPALVHTYMKLRNFRIYLMMRDLIGKFRKTSSQLIHGATEVDPTATLMARIVSEKIIPLDSPLYQKGARQFESNMIRIMDKAAEAGVPVILSDLVSNVHDQSPFVSVHTDENPEANTVYKQAQQSERSKNYDEARTEYIHAKDLDALRFRATELWNDILQKISKKYQTPLVPMKDIFESESPHALTGDNLMVDHLHPNMDGYFIMADAFFNTMHENAFIAPEWEASRIVELATQKNSWAISPLDSVYAELSIRYLKGSWPFQPENRPNHAMDDFIQKNQVDSLAIYALMRNEISLEQANFRLAEYYESKGMDAWALKVYKALYYAIPHEVLFYHRAGNLLVKQQRFDEAYDVFKQSNRIKINFHAIKWMGQIHLMRNQLFEAIPLLEKAITLDKPDDQILYNLGRAYIQTLQLLKAQKIAEQIQTQSPGSPFVQHLGAQIRKMRPILEKIGQLNQEAHQYIGSKEYAKATAKLDESIHLCENETANLLSAQVYIYLKEYETALEYIKKALFYNPHDTRLLYRAAGLYLQTGKKQNASELLDQIYQIEPEFVDTMRLGEQLDSQVTNFDNFP